MTAVEWHAVVALSGGLCLPDGRRIKFAAAYNGRTVTIWADARRSWPQVVRVAVRALSMGRLVVLVVGGRSVDMIMLP
ncbi:hypothetical protein AB0M95_02265 [Sphaerisporangium sp. NPDC051017]|uniref:hypothetical protein n=1 Tax=Sphaerisporangium sp. NPDC051017 TaxID=3154636 RepID=UPI003418AE51